jgi:DNA-binding transcriptional MerR regulator
MGYLDPSSDVERETGFGKDLLRKWRQRYGFPISEATAGGKVGYSRETITHLLLIRRLLEDGFRPAQVVGKSPLELDRLRQVLADEVSASCWNKATCELMSRIKQTDFAGLERLLTIDRRKETLTEFVLNTLVPLIGGVGESWKRGEIDIFHEHICTSIITRALHAEILSISPKPDFPRILFATPPEEDHALGLLMAEAVLADQGARTLNAGPNTPLYGLRAAAISCKVNVVALSFSFSFTARRVRPTLVHLRQLLPPDIQVWAGGAGTAILKRPPKGVRVFSDFQQAVMALHDFVKQEYRRPLA